MPVSLGEWRVGIGRFVRWQTKEFDFDVYLQELFEKRRQKLQLLLDLIQNTVNRAKCSKDDSKDSSSSDSSSASKSTHSTETDCKANREDTAPVKKNGSIGNFSDAESQSKSTETSRNCSKRETADALVTPGDTSTLKTDHAMSCPGGEPKCPAGVSSSACSATSDNTSTPNTKELLLQKAGDVELNPGPRNSDGCPSSGDFDDILKSVARNLRGNDEIDDLGKALGFEVPVIQRYIDNNTLHGVVTYEGTLRMLRDWYGRQREAEARQALKDALVTAKLIRLADEFLRSNETGSQSNTSPSISPELLQQCIDELREFYNIELCQIQTDPMNFDALLEFEKIFTNLILLGEDRATQQKTPLKYEDLLKTKVNGVFPKRLLVQGEGGAGKSTLCAKIAWDWANGKGFEQFKMVMVVPLRKAKGKTVGEIVKSYLSDSNPVQPRQIDEYILSHPNDVFLVFDGLDEFDGEFTSEEDLIKILINERFKSSTVLVTSRPWKADQIRRFRNLKKVYAFIGVEGFTRENIDSYVEKFFAQDEDTVKVGEDLIMFMKDNEIIAENMAPYPIYTAMLCVMWRAYDGERRKAMSKLHTFSQLFNEMIDFLVDHYISKSVENDYDEKILANRREVNDCLHETGKIAFDLLLEKRLFFTEDEFISNQKAWETCCHVGVLTMEKSIASRSHRNDASKSILFPHKLFQEYLSAMHLAFLYKSNHEEYERLLNDRVLPTHSEYTNLLFFLSALEKGAGVDIISHFSSIDIKIAVDMAFECHEKVAVEAINAYYPAISKYLHMYMEMKNHTFSGYLFVINSDKVKTIKISRHCGYTHSSELAHLICTSPSLRVATIGWMGVFGIVLEDCFFSVLADKAHDSKVETLEMIGINLLKRASESRDLAKAICTMPHLSTLSLKNFDVHDDFYSAMSSTASSAKVGLIILNKVELSQDCFHTFISLPKLQEVRIKLIYIPIGHSPAGGYEKGKNCTSVSPASRLTIDNHTLRIWRHGHMPTIFPCVHEVTVLICTIFPFLCVCDYPKEATLPSAKELVLEQYRFCRDSITTEDIPSLIGFIQHFFPNVSSLTFRDLDIKNPEVEIIMDSLTKVTQLHSIRFTRCNTDSSLDSLVKAFGEAHDLKITIEHKIPEKTKWEEMYSEENREDSIPKKTKWDEMDSEENSEDGNSEDEDNYYGHDDEDYGDDDDDDDGDDDEDCDNDDEDCSDDEDDGDDDEDCDNDDEDCDNDDEDCSDDEDDGDYDEDCGNDGEDYGDDEDDDYGHDDEDCDDDDEDYGDDEDDDDGNDCGNDDGYYGDGDDDQDYGDDDE